MLMTTWFAEVGIRLLDKVGNDRADEAADFGRRRVLAAVTDSLEASCTGLSLLVSYCLRPTQVCHCLC